MVQQVCAEPARSADHLRAVSAEPVAASPGAGAERMAVALMQRFPGSLVWLGARTGRWWAFARLDGAYTLLDGQTIDEIAESLADRDTRTTEADVSFAGPKDLDRADIRMSGIRLCAKCGETPLSRYNRGSLCSACVRNQFDATNPVHVDLLQRVHQARSVWRTEAMRAALARIDMSAVLATYRRAAGLSQREIGKLVNWSQVAVSKAETGKSETLYDIRELIRFADRVAVPREALLPIILGLPGARE